jgi:hypothetical protein
MQDSPIEEQHQNETVLTSGKAKKRKFEENINQHQQTTEHISSHQSATMFSLISGNKKSVCRSI